MNMKKTIAAIAAGAVAVSAMATTVSALESTTLTYNLVHSVPNDQKGSVTLKATFRNISLPADSIVRIAIGQPSDGAGWGNKFIVSGSYSNTNETIVPMTFTSNTWSDGFGSATKEGATFTSPVDGTTQEMYYNYFNAWNSAYNSAATGYASYINIPVLATGSNNGQPALKGGAASTGVASAAATYSQGGTGAPITITATGLDKINTALNGASGVLALTFDGTDWKDAAGTAYTLADLGISFPAVSPAITLAANDVITINYTAPKTSTVTADITVTATLPALTEKYQSEFVDHMGAGQYWIGLNQGDTQPANTSAYVKGDVAYSGFAASSTGSDASAPFMTNITDNADIIRYLETANVNGFKKHYVNVGAVLNDAIQNYENVTFTFNTATQKVLYQSGKFVKNGTGYAVKIEGAGVGDGNLDYDQKYMALTSEAMVDSDVAMRNKLEPAGSNYVWRKMGVYKDDKGSTDKYMAFGEHTYDWNYAPENTGYLGFDWAGTNLFAGALVVNESYTMSLSNTDYFDWTKTSLSFDWDAIMDGAATNNDYATYIHSIKLATSSMWFWDSMDVVLTAGEVDEATADAGAEGDDETLDTGDEEAADEEISGDEEPADEEPADEEPAPVVEPEPAPAPVANPQTGNASVALAVIPVALAAAAIVAKKRG